MEKDHLCCARSGEVFLKVVQQDPPPEIPSPPPSHSDVTLPTIPPHTCSQAVLDAFVCLWWNWSHCFLPFSLSLSLALSCLVDFHLLFDSSPISVTRQPKLRWRGPTIVPTTAIPLSHAAPLL